MAQTRYVANSDPEIALEPLEISSLIRALEGLKKESIHEIAKRMRVQIHGFRLKKASKSKIIESIVEKGQKHSIADLVELIFCAINQEYPALIKAVFKEEGFDLDYWLEICNESILFLVLSVEGKEHKKDLEKLRERIGNQSEKPVSTYQKDRAVCKISETKKPSVDEVDAIGRATEEKQLRKALSERDRALYKTKQTVKKLEVELKTERSQAGKYTQEIGLLRKENKQLKEALSKVKPLKQAKDREVSRLSDENKKLKEIVSGLERDLSRYEITNENCGCDLEKLIRKKAEYQLEALKWEARWYTANLLRLKDNQTEEIETEILINPEELKRACQKAVYLAEDFLLENFGGLDPAKRKVALDGIRLLMDLEQLINKAPFVKGVPVKVRDRGQLGKSRDFAIVTGIFAYEGPHGWLRTKEGSFLIIPEDVLRYNLVTGDKIELKLKRQFTDEKDVGNELRVLEKTECKEVVCTLEKEGDEIFVANTYNYDLQISLGEFEYINYNLIDPVTVIYPDMGRVKLPSDEIIYARVVKTHDPTWEKAPPRERKRSEKRRLTETEEETAYPLLKDQVILCVGGESFKEQLKGIVNDLNGEFLFQPGFDSWAKVEGNVKKADLVVFITTELSHSIKKSALKAATKYQKEHRYYNERGAVLFKDLLGCKE